MDQATFDKLLAGGAKNFDGQDLSYLNLAGKNLSECSFQRANLKACDFTGADIGDLMNSSVFTRLRGVRCEGANFSGVRSGHKPADSLRSVLTSLSSNTAGAKFTDTRAAREAAAEACKNIDLDEHRRKCDQAVVDQAERLRMMRQPEKPEPRDPMGEHIATLKREAERRETIRRQCAKVGPAMERQAKELAKQIAAQKAASVYEGVNSPTRHF